MKINAVIIDDSPDIRELLKTLLFEYFPDIEISGTAAKVGTGVKLIRDAQPQIVFMDIELEDGSGFQILQKLRPYSFKLIFVTAFNNFAIRAFKFSAMDYILKPVNESEFKQAVENAINDIDKDITTIPYDSFMDIYERKTQNRRLVLKTAESVHIVDISEIMFCRSDNTYTSFFLDSGQEILVSRSIKEYDELLNNYGFFRPHQSYLVNLSFVRRLDKADGGFIIMKNKHEIPVSSRRKKQLMHFLDRI